MECQACPFASGFTRVKFACVTWQVSTCSTDFLSGDVSFLGTNFFSWYQCKGFVLDCGEDLVSETMQREKKYIPCTLSERRSLKYKYKPYHGNRRFQSARHIESTVLILSFTTDWMSIGGMHPIVFQAQEPSCLRMQTRTGKSLQGNRREADLHKMFCTEVLPSQQNIASWGIPGKWLHTPPNSEKT